MSTSEAELIVRIADRLEEDDELVRSMQGLKRLPRFVRPAVRARLVHQLCESPPLSELNEVVTQARARCAEQIKDQSVEPGETVVYPFEWDVTIEVDAERVGQIQCTLDIEFDAARLWRSLKTTGEAGNEGPPADLSLSVSVGAPDVSDATPTLQYGPWTYPS